MAEIKTRIQLKYDSYANWTTSNGTTQANKTHGDTVLKAGEIGICAIDSNNIQTKNPNDLVATQIMFKVGDGQTAFKNLQWASALAADVYTWAKQSTLFVDDTTATTTTSGDKTYTGNAITSAEWDATLNEGKGGVKFTKGAQFATKAELDAAIEAFGGDLSAITDTDTQYLFSTNGDKLVVKKVKYTNGVAGVEESVGEYEFLTADEAEEIANGLIGKANIEIKIAENGGLTIVDDGTFNVNATENKTITLKHANTSDVTNVTAEDRTYVKSLTFDDFGHVTAVTTGTETVIDTDTKTTVAAGDDYIRVNGALNVNDSNTFTVSINESALKTLIGEQTTAAMEFKGATAALPVSPDKGDMYKVSSSFEVAGEIAKVGDSIVYDGEQWYLIPSGDDIEDTWRPIKVGDHTLESSETLELAAGFNVVIEEEDGKVTISAVDTTYQADEETLTKDDSGNTFSIKDSGVTTIKIADNAITGDKIDADYRTIIEKNTEYTVAATDTALQFKVIPSNGGNGEVITLKTPTAVQRATYDGLGNKISETYVPWTRDDEDKGNILELAGESLTINRGDNNSAMNTVSINAYNVSISGGGSGSLNFSEQDSSLGIDTIQVGEKETGTAIEAGNITTSSIKTDSAQIRSTDPIDSDGNYAYYNVLHEGMTLVLNCGSSTELVD